MIRWLRRVVPPSAVLLGLAVAWAPYLVLSAVWAYFLAEPLDREVRQIALYLPGFCLVCYGVYRAVRFHPHFRPNYAAWLARTPWTPDKPLPDGPVLLAWQDVFVLGVFLGPVWLVFGREAWPVVPSFAFAYLLGLAILLYRTAERAAAYLVLFGLGGALLLGHLPPAALGVLAAAYAAAAVGFRRSLHGFPWPPDADELARMWVSAAKTLGWPFDRLMPLADPSPLRPWEGPTRGLLVAWALFAVGFQLSRAAPDIRGDRPVIILDLVPLFVCLNALIRVVEYVVGHLPPISLLGRLATGRLVIPGYDVVFVAPLAAVVAVFAVPHGFATAGFAPYVGIAVGAGLAVGILATAGPDRARWQLTAPCRLVPLLRQPPKPRPIAGSQPPRG